MRPLLNNYAMIALSMMGSAILLFSCDNKDSSDAGSEEAMMTEYSENLSIVMSQNGRRSYHFETPLVEGYTLAREPYREFRKGVKIITFQDDSLSSVDAILTANYAIFYETRQLWEAKGNVVVEKSDGKTLYTQQLFWNQLTKKIYSNVDSKIVQYHGRDTFIGEGFESDEEFKDWRFRRMKGRMEVDVTPNEGADSTATATSPPPAAASQSAASDPKPATKSREQRKDSKPLRPEDRMDSRIETRTDALVEPAPAATRRSVPPKPEPMRLSNQQEADLQHVIE